VDKNLSNTQKIILWTVVSLCLALVLALILNFESILSDIGNFLIVNEVPQKADVIIVLNGSYDRVPYAAMLYQSGYAEKVLLSGDNGYMTQQALSLGIPKSALILEDQSKTTFGNAQYSLNIIKQQGYNSAIVVTDQYHTRRASIIFAHFFKGILLTICPVPYNPAITQIWWKNSNSREFVISEYLKFGWYYIVELH
jgi:uncharacterized SAM-binding protein YcdF (DUF218 family)